MKRYFIVILMGILVLVSCNKEKEFLAHDFMSTVIDTLVIGDTFSPSSYVTLPPAKVSFYLEGPIEDFKGKVGATFSDHASDSLYIRDNMLFIQEVSSFEKNDDNEKYWKVPFVWIPKSPQVEANKIYCFIIQCIWEDEGISRVTWRNYIYMKGN